MNQRSRKTMDKKKNKTGKRRKSNAGKRHGRAEPEEKPKSAEVMNEKEKQDRLEAANVLSSLMFCTPKTSEENKNVESGAKCDPVTPSSSVTQISLRTTTSGIPATSQPTSLVLGGRGSPGSSAIAESAVNLKNSMILAQLQNQLSLALKNKNVNPVIQPQTHPAFAQNSALTTKSGVKSKLSQNDKSDSQNVPLTVLKQNLTVNKNVAKALRQAVSNNKQKSELPVAENLQGKTNDNVPGEVATNKEQERMECESLPSSRKAGGTDNNLPLKKRRLIGMNDESMTLTTSDLNFGVGSNAFMSTNLDTLASARQIQNILQMAKDYPATSADSALSLVTSLTQTKVQEGSGYRPVQFDPRTSLMVLSDLKFALTPDEDGDLPIHIAVVHENIDLVKKFIDIMAVSGKTVDRFNKLQQTPLHLAVLVNKPEIVSVLLVAGANPNLLDRHGYTSVHIAVNKEQHECMDTVFENSKVPVSLNTRDYEGYYPLHTCVELNNFDMMVALVKKGAEVDSQDGKAGRSVLLYAVEYNRGDMVQYLLNSGAQADLQNYASVTPMMIAQAANQDDIVAYLSKALDVGSKYDESYIPTKKLPVQIRMPVKGFQIGNKDRNVRHSLSDEMPLIYEEYNGGSKPQTFSDNLKKEPLSRQSSVSSPIDLSMRHNTKSPSQLSNEMSIRGKPGRRKTKKEHKNHKEKHQQKSIVKEKHASVVAALERSMFAEKPFPRKMDDKAPVMDYKLIEKYIKVEAQDNVDVETKNKTENGGIVDIEKSNLPSTNISDFILNMKPDQAKILVEKVRQQLNVHKDQITTMSPNSASSYATESDVESKTGDKVKSPESDTERHQDNETSDGKNENQVNDRDKGGKYHVKIVSLKDNSVSEIEDIEMNVEEAEKEKETKKEILKDSKDSSVIALQSESSGAPTDKENDCENGSMNHSLIDNEKNDVQETTGSPSEKLVSHIGSKIDSNQKYVSVNNENEADESDMLTNKENMHKQVKNHLKECIVNRNENSRSSVSKSDTHEKLSKTKELVSQISQESGSSSSLQGSQGSHGFEVISPPVLSGIQCADSGVFRKEYKEAEHSEDSMEVDFNSVNQDLDQKESTPETAVNVKEANLEKVNAVDDKISANDDSESMVIDFEENAKASIDTDEEDEESGLVIDECVEDETENNGDTMETSDKNASEDVNIETDGSDASEVTKKDARDTGFNETSGEINENNMNEDGKSSAVCNGELYKEREKSDDKKDINGENLSNSEKSSEVTELDISNGKTIRNAESPSLIQPEDAKPNAQVIKEEVYKKRIVDAGGLHQSIPQEEMLKKGQSHTLFYRDGDGYKPIKIFIDNSEQSSLVLQRMFQSAQLANVNRQTGPVAACDIKRTPATQSNISDSRNLVTTNSVRENSFNKVVSSPLNVKVESVSVASTKPSGIVTTPSLTEVASQQSYQQVYVDTIKQKSSEESSVKNNSNAIKQSRKRTPSKSDSSSSSQIKPVARFKISNSSKTFDSKTFIETYPPSRVVNGVLTKPFNAIAAKYTSEGTLTRVNPDIRSKLSKALLSQKKVGLVRSESDTNIAHSKGVLANVVTSVPATLHTSVIDSRQQL